MRRHLRTVHGIADIQINNIITLAKTITKTQKSCPICFTNVGELAKHLMQKHTFPRLQAYSTAAETKVKRNDEEESVEFVQSLCEYTNYSLISLGYKEKTHYFERHLENLNRFGKVIVKLGMDPNDILIIEQDDPEAEKAGEYMISSYLQQMKENNLTATSAKVYLNDIKKFLKIHYRFRNRVPLRDFIDLQISHCHRSQIGKLNEEKYKDRVDLVLALSKHDKCKYVASIKEKIDRGSKDPTMDWIEARNYLMFSILVENFQRPGIIYNMTTEELEDSFETLDNNEEVKMTIKVRRHKTDYKFGPAHIHMPLELYQRVLRATGTEGRKK